MSYLFYIALFGEAVCIFLWLRDIRIHLRTALPGYRNAARKGVLHSALTTAGAGMTFLFPSADILGVGIVLLGLYLQGQEKREKIFTTEPVLERFFGKTPDRR